MKAMTQKQIDCIAYIDEEAKRYVRLAKRARDVGCPLMSTALYQVIRQMRQACEMQAEMLREPEKFLPFSEQTEDVKIIE
jgi:hypothetical protein